MNKWSKTVKEVFKKNRAVNPSYMFKDALKDARKVYHSGEKIVLKTAKTGKKMVSKTAKTGKKMVSKTYKGIKKGFRGKTQKKRGSTKKNHRK
jgi:hypothetical protein